MKQTTEKSILWDRLLQFFIFCQESTQQLWFEKTEMIQSIDIFPVYSWPKGKVHLFLIPCTVFKYLHECSEKKSMKHQSFDLSEI